MPRRSIRTLLAGGLAAALVVLTGCSGSGATEPLAASVAPSPSAAESPSPLPSPSPSLSPSPSPAALSPFEKDPAVMGLRAYGKAAAAAVNARNLELPALVAATTKARAQRAPAIFREEIGRFFPGPAPFLVRSVRTASASEKHVLGCFAEDGWSRTKRGGPPAAPLKILGLDIGMRLVGGVWKLDTGTRAKNVSCAGLTLKDLS